MNLRKLLIGFLLFFTLILGVGAVTLRYFLPSVLFAHVEAGDPVGEPFFIVLNPLRELQPEDVADQFLAKLKDGKCEEVVTNLKSAATHNNHICDGESAYRLVSWQLFNRTDSSDKTASLYYRVIRSDDSSHRRNVWLTIEKNGDAWMVTDMESIY